MPDAYGMPTPEERLLARLREQAQQAATMGRGQAAPQMSPATTPGTLTPEQMRMAARNLRPQENQLEQQQSMAMNLMNSPSAKGIQAGDVYAAPTWTSQLASAVRQGTGAYAAYDAGKKRQALNKEQADIDAAKGDVAMEDLTRTIGNEQFDRDTKTANLGLATAAGERDDKRLEHSIMDSDRTYLADRADAKRKLAMDAADVETVGFIDSNGTRYNTRGVPNADGVVTYFTGENFDVPIDVSNMTPAPTLSGTARTPTPKYPKTYYMPDGSKIDTVMVGTDRIDISTGEPAPDIREAGGREALSEGKLATDLTKFDKNTQDMRRLAGAFNRANATLDEYGVDIFSGDVPLGALENMVGGVGGGIRTIRDAFRADPQAGDIFSAMNEVIAQIIRESAGLSQTQAEIQQISNTFGRNWYNDPSLLVKAWPRLQKKLAAETRSMTASTHPQVVAEYRANLANEGGTDWTKIGVGLDPELPPLWFDPDKPNGGLDPATASARRDVDRRGRPRSAAPPVAAPAPYDDPDKERRYAEWLSRQGQ